MKSSTSKHDPLREMYSKRLRCWINRLPSERPRLRVKEKAERLAVETAIRVEAQPGEYGQTRAARAVIHIRLVNGSAIGEA